MDSSPTIQPASDASSPAAMLNDHEQTFYDVPSLKSSTSECSPKQLLLVPSPPTICFDIADNMTPSGHHMTKSIGILDTPILQRSQDDSFKEFLRERRLRKERAKSLEAIQVECKMKIGEADRQLYMCSIKLKAAATKTVSKYSEHWDTAKELDKKKAYFDEQCKRLKEALKNGENCDELEEIVEKLQDEVDGLAAQVQEKDIKKDESSDKLHELALEYCKYKEFKNKMLDEYARVSEEIKNLKGAGGGPQ